MEIITASDFAWALEVCDMGEGAGYHDSVHGMVFILQDGGTLSVKAARENRGLMLSCMDDQAAGTGDPSDAQWIPLAMERNSEEGVFCCHLDEPIIQHPLDKLGMGEDEMKENENA